MPRRSRLGENPKGFARSMFVLGIIPARGGSKRVARKNVRRLAGKPLVSWAIEAGRHAQRVDRLVVSSDDDEVLDIAAKYDRRLPLRRPPELSTDTSLAIEYIRHAIQTLETAQSPRIDAVVVIQPSSPLTLACDIDSTIDLLHASGADSAVSVVELRHDLHPAKLKRMQGDRLLPYYEDEQGKMASHELPRVFVRNCSVYASKRAAIDAGRIIGDDCRGFIMPRERSVDINDELDFAFTEFLVGRMSPQ
jgi:CMP-N,N'-diacetyllegionaminic acid synthase